MILVIMEEEFVEVWKIWGDVFVVIVMVYDEKGIDVVIEIVEGVFDGVYGYNFGDVFFKLMFVSGQQMFCFMCEGVLLYFVVYNDFYLFDGGFVFKGWCKVELEILVSFIQGDVVMWMGWVYCIDKDGNMMIVDKSWGYKKDENGMLCIVLYYFLLFYQFIEFI